MGLATTPSADSPLARSPPQPTSPVPMGSISAGLASLWAEQAAGTFRGPCICYPTPNHSH